MLRSALAAAGMTLALLGCTGDPVTVVYVTLEARPAVRNGAELEVTVANANATIVERFDIDRRSFPLSFTVTPNARLGELRVEAVVYDADGIPVGLGSGATDIVTDQRVDLPLMVEPADFVVNTTIAGLQKHAFSPGRSARQLGVAPDGGFTIAFVNDCNVANRCDVFARRFGPHGADADNGVTMDTREFVANLENQYTDIPSVAVGAAGILITWDTTVEVRGVPMTPDARHLGFADKIISNTTLTPSDPAAAALADGTYVVVWTERDFAASTEVVMARLLDAGGAPLVNPVTNDNGPFQVSTAPNSSAKLPGVAAVGDGKSFAVVWRDRGNLYGRFFDEGAVPRPQTQAQLTSYATTATVSAPQLALTREGVAVTWSVRDVSTPGLEDGRLVLRRYAARTGSPIGAEVVVQASAANTNTTPDVAARADGTLAVAWHDCGATGDGLGCGVFAQYLRPNGLPIGDRVLINTTLRGDQTEPSIGATPDAFVVTWSDTSEAPPDTSSGAIRARLVYPSLDRNDGTRGARCGRDGDAACGQGLVCISGSAQVPYCHEPCDPSGPEPHCPSGGLCTTQNEQSACIF